LNQPTPAIVAQSAVRRLPRDALLLFCLAYVLPGFSAASPGRTPTSRRLATWPSWPRASSTWLNPTLLGRPPEFDALLPYWLGAWAMHGRAGLAQRRIWPRACRSA
jgi:hypothetical protein